MWPSDKKVWRPLAYCVNYCSIPGSWVSLTTKRIFCDCCRYMGRFLCDVERVKRFMNVHLHCIISNLKIIRKMSTLTPLEKCLRTPMTITVVLRFENELITF